MLQQDLGALAPVGAVELDHRREVAHGGCDGQVALAQQDAPRLQRPLEQRLRLLKPRRIRVADEQRQVARGRGGGRVLFAHHDAIAVQGLLVQRRRRVRIAEALVHQREVVAHARDGRMLLAEGRERKSVALLADRERLLVAPFTVELRDPWLQFGELLLLGRGLIRAAALRISAE